MATTFRALNEEHFGVVNPLNTVFYSAGGGQTGATLSAAIAAQGGSQKTILVTPGSWNVGSNLTIPSNIHLWLTGGAQLSVGAGANLVINGAFTAPDMQVFTGAGNVVFGPGVEGVNPLWVGAKFDDATDDTAALNRAIAIANVSNKRTVRLPPGIARFTSQIIIPSQVSIKGAGQNSSILRKMGNINGLLYAGAITLDWYATFEDFSVLGSSANTGYLLGVQGEAWNARCNHVRLRGTSQNALILSNTAGFVFENGEISEFGLAGITNSGFANRITVVNNLFNRIAINSTTADIDLLNAAAWEIHSNGFQGGDSPPTTSKGVLRMNGCISIDFHSNYAERYDGVLISGVGASPCQDISIHHNILHSFHPFKVIFEENSLPHDEIHVYENRFDGVSEITRIFGPGQTQNFSFVNNKRGTVVEPLAYVIGYPPDKKTVIKRNQDIFVSGIAVGDWTKTLSLIGSTLTLKTEGIAHNIDIMAGAGGGVVQIGAFDQVAAQFSGESDQGSNLSRLILYDVDNGQLYQVKFAPNASVTGIPNGGRVLYVDQRV